MSSNPTRQRLLSPTEYIGLLIGAQPPEEQDEPQNVFDAVYRVLPQRGTMPPMPFPDTPPPYQLPPVTMPRGIGGGWGQ